MPRSHSTNWTRLPLEKRVALVRWAQQGDAKARDRLVRLCRPTVRTMAHHYEGRGLPIEDLESDGVLGLLRAIPAYDPGNGHDFLAFASPRIRAAILRGLAEEARMVRLPQHLAESVPRVRGAMADLRASLGRAPTAGEVTRAVRIPRRVVESVMEYLASFPPGRPLRRIRNEDAFPPDPHEDEVGAEIAAADRHRVIEGAIDGLDPWQQQVLRLRWGIEEGPAGGRRRTQREVGELLRLRRRKVHEIESAGFERLERILRERARDL